MSSGIENGAFNVVRYSCGLVQVEGDKITGSRVLWSSSSPVFRDPYVQRENRNP